MLQAAAGGGQYGSDPWHHPGQRAHSDMATLHSVLLGWSQMERQEENIFTAGRDD